MALKEQFEKFINSENLCEEFDKDTLKTIGTKVIEWFDTDEESRSEWKQRNEQWLKLATQVMEKKTYPWPNSANVKFPLLTTAAMQFAARAYPALVAGPKLVQGLVIGKDEGGQKQESAERVGNHMSYQVLHEMKGWEEDMDRLCLALPISGVLFKKTYYSDLKGTNCSELVFPDQLVVDYFAKSLEEANRIHHIIFLNKNQIKERINNETFLDVELGEPQTVGEMNAKDAVNGTSEPQVTPATPHKFVECHCWWDTDDDGYDEPYVVTVHYDTRKVVRIVARFDIDGVELGQDKKGKEKLIKITPIQYFTKFGFIPNPDGSIYDLGFGLLLGGINETINTLTNQLLDAGSINNLQSGFLGRGIRVRSGQSRFQPGEWKPVDFTGDDIKKHIFPLPTKEPSEVLFKLLETFVTSGKELASVAEIFVGKMPGQNTPATTTMATIEQGLKVFTAIYKRIYRALNEEYAKLFRLNSQYMDETVYFTVNALQGPEAQEAYRTDYDPKGISVKPNSDPNIVSSAQKMMRIQAMGPLLALKTINPQEYTKRFLEAIEADNITALMQVEPQPDPEVMKVQMEGQMKAQEHQMKMQLEQLKLQFKEKELQMELQFKEQELRLKAVESKLKIQTSQAETQNQMQLNEQTHAQDMQMQHDQHQMDAQQSHQEHQQGMEQSKEQHTQKIKQTKEAAAAKPKPSSQGAKK